MSAAAPWLNDLLAANGRPVRENFGDWFGASKVVGTSGEPLRVFLSSHSEFDAFAKTRDVGFHFGSSGIANKRADESSTGRGRGDTKYDGLHLIPAFLSLQNPLHLSEDPRAWEPGYVLQLVGDHVPAHVRKRITELDASAVDAARIDRKTLIEADGPGLRREKQRWEGGKTYVDVKQSVWTGLLAQHRPHVYMAIREALQIAGFDGLSYLNQYEGEGSRHLPRAKNPANLTWVAFTPSQVKSALCNSGLFQRDNPSMTERHPGIADDVSAALARGQRARRVAQAVGRAGVRP